MATEIVKVATKDEREIIEAMNQRVADAERVRLNTVNRLYPTEEAVQFHPEQMMWTREVPEPETEEPA